MAMLKRIETLAVRGLGIVAFGGLALLGVLAVGECITHLFK